MLVTTYKSDTLVIRIAFCLDLILTVSDFFDRIFSKEEYPETIRVMLLIMTQLNEYEFENYKPQI